MAEGEKGVKDAGIRRVEELATRLAGEVGLEVVSTDYLREPGGMVLRVTIDTRHGVNVEDCARLSEVLAPALDALDTPRNGYRLEVCSPGLERPLTRESEYERFAGERVEVKTRTAWEGRRRHVGTLEGLVDGAVVLDTDEGRVAIPLDEVVGARLKPEFKF